MQSAFGAGTLFLCALLLLAGSRCARREPLTEQRAQSIVRSWAPPKEPVYAEVPQRVWWSPQAPKDEYDGQAVRTLQNLEKAGLITLTSKVAPDGTTAEYVGKVTEKGFRILGTAPSNRGPVFRAKIAEKTYDGLRNFQRHPTEETVGHGELIWHYQNPTWLYPLFETKINKPLNTPFASHISFFYKDRQWQFDVTVAKTEAQ